MEDEKKMGTCIEYQLPSALIAEGRGTEALMEASKILGKNLEEFCNSVMAA